MSAKKREVSTESAIRHNNPSPFIEDGQQREPKWAVMQNVSANELELLELCACFPLAPSARSPQTETGTQDTTLVQEGYIVPTTPQFNHVVRTHLKHHLPCSAPLSVLMLHVSQLEQPMLPTEGEHVYQRRRYHVSQNVLAQILNNVQRAIRSQDSLLVEAGVGAAMLFPAVDEQGIQNIVERVYQSICLLQAETIVPQLLRVTDIVLGCGTYAGQDFFQYDIEQAIEELLTHTGHIARRLLLRPALATSLWETMPHIESLTLAASPTQNASEHSANADDETLLIEEYEPYEHQEMHYPALSTTQASSSIPFLHLPAKLSSRLKHLVPYSLACQLQCAPVGRDHHTLTVAMVNPTDNFALQRLQESTGMTIFPVSCDSEALAALLAERW